MDAMATQTIYIQPGTTEPTVPSFPDWVATLCRALHERQHLPFSGHRTLKVLSQLLASCFVPSTTPETEKLINRSINTSQVESGTRDVGDKWIFRTFKAQGAETSTHTSLIYKPKMTSVFRLPH